MRLTIVLVVGVCLLLAFPAEADGDDLYRDTLVGLPGLAVVVENISNGSDALRDEISVMAELALRSAGIRVLTRDELIRSPAVAYLYVRVGLGAPRAMQIYTVEVEIRQSVTLANGRRAYGASTWNAPNSFGIAHEASINAVIRQSLAPMLDRACNDFLKANPRTPPSLKPTSARKRDPKIEEVDPEPVSNAQP
ncbi:hypothetical protein JYJ95_37865 [Corallococcus exiguus]|uniref:hypothetical protein n=1 Tax=Corallococcus exiguus TaxID=83462 RepID=UPI001A8EF264|nr:hypothetical protein [Corallococcus exiguus]MBN8472304.1 hypothetical protein [Corallococcus exiguus]